MKWVIKITGDINKLRAEIDEVDKKIIELILKRMEIVHQVGLTKSKNKTRVYVPEREVAIYKRLSSFSNLSPKDIQSFYTEIISFCRKLEGILNVGVKADSISLLGVKKLFGEYVNPIFFNTFNELDLTSTKYILSKFSKDMLDFLLENNWHVINKTEIQGETLY
ncbi:chorismate mutase, partial [Cetobacterium sp.]|uniref:chorismate mutase n=1 Tax=Cetobacterium sp. TaxID=2071632 RepID=UPI003AF002BA